MINFLGFEISFTTIAIWATLWGCCVAIWIMSLRKKDYSNNDIVKRLSLDEGRKFMLNNKKYKGKYGQIYENNISKLFREDSFFDKIGQQLVPNSYDMERKLNLVGSDLTVEEFISIKVLSLIIGLGLILLGVALNSNLVFIGIGALSVIISFGLEEQIVGEKIKKRTILIERGLPNFLDLLYSACKTGHTITEGIMKTSSKYPGLISDEFNRAMIEFKTNGGDFRQALENMMDRNDIESLTNVLSDILISYEKGDNQIIETIKSEGKNMRDIVNAEIEELANKKTTTLIIPMLIFEFVPTMLFVLIPLLSQFTALMGS